jgi:RNA polymerase sigma-70 factor (ECF subfamily)
MTITEQVVTTSRDANFELEITAQGLKWSWSLGMFQMLGVANNYEPGPHVLMNAKHPTDRRSTLDVLSQAIKQRTSFCYQSRLARHDGYVRRVETSGSVAESGDGSPLAVVGSVVLVSDWALPSRDRLGDGKFTDGEMEVALRTRAEYVYAYAFVQYAPLVRRAAGALLRDRTQIEDVVQSVFESLWRHPERFNSDRGSLLAYLRLQARGRSVDLLRSESCRAARVRRFAGTSDVSNGDEYDGVFELSRPDLRRCLDLLPTTERQVIELAYFGGMTYRGVATHLDLPEGTVKWRIRSGLVRLRQLECIKAAGAATLE